jgi:hypothetical protein
VTIAVRRLIRRLAVRDRHEARPSLDPPLGPVLAVWALAGLTAAAVFVTYSRVDPARLYHVSGEGLGGGASRLVVTLSFPVAVIALPLLPIAVARLRGTPGTSRRERSAVAAVALVAAALCATVVVSVEQADLDARWLNAPTVAGTILAAALTAYVARRTGIGRSGRRLPLAGWAAIGVLVIVALPWIAAVAGVSLGRAPVVGGLFNADEAAVHLGDHHGFDGALLAISAILVWPALASMARDRLRSLAVFVVALELTYGVANAVQDAWLEQVVKRGWSDTDLPSVVVPSLSVEWGAIVAGAVALWWVASARLQTGERGGKSFGAPTGAAT